ncbi:hypothetical protein [Paracoccus spongiarum]|uniref:Peptidase inhibitor I78 family protein n=1 Tax=Paracoccus spongiarum TaxID=3064387 RepID=A0ABT9JC22_9RHOB|nr:hypothetical protein [Paracoccus sp. 2205BS29-5]MDP5307155.1 hypothetical protein [Paracoccus sp. 2205BS29-5]
MITTRFLPSAALIAAAAVAACAPVAPPPPVAAPLPVAPIAPLPADGIAGLEERQPDLCGAKTYVPSLGQPGSVIPSLGIAKEYRVVEYRGIEPQEYNPQRIVFRLDASGNIYNIDCG